MRYWPSRKIKLSHGVPALIIAATLFTLSQFYRASVAVISPNLIQDLNFGAWELGMVSAAFFYAFALMQIPVGIFLDSIGPRITMTVLTLVAAGGAFLFAAGGSYVPLSIGRALMGIGMACNFMGTLKLITIWFDRKYFATLSSLVVSAGTAGTIAAATPLVLLVQFMGWRHSFVAMGSVTILLAGLCFLLANDCPASPDEKANSGSGQRPTVTDTLKSARILLRQKDFWIISLATFCRYGIFAAIQALWAGPYLIHAAGLSAVQAGNILLLMSVGIILGTPFCGYLSDAVFVSRKKVVITGLFGMTLVLGILIYLPSGTGPWLLTALFVWFGLFSSTGQLMYAHIKEQVPLENAGMAMTAINFFTMAGVAVFLQGMGALMKYLYPGTSLGIPAFKSAFILCAACLAFIGILYTRTRETL